MCCVLSLLIFIGPRIAGVAWYFIDTARWNVAFDNLLLPIVGLLLLPWTTMAYVFVSPAGVSGLDWLIVALGLLIDIASIGGGGYSNRNRRNR